MNPLLRLAVLTTAAGILFTGTAAPAMAVGYSRLRSVLAQTAPSRRAAWLLAAAAP